MEADATRFRQYATVQLQDKAFGSSPVVSMESERWGVGTNTRWMIEKAVVQSVDD